MKPLVSVVVPVYNEGSSVVPFLDSLFEAVRSSSEVIAVYDFPEDTTAPYLEEYARTEPRLVPMVNTYGRGPALAIRYGIDHAAGDVVVVTMADGSDDPHLIESLVRLVENGVAVASASRYSAGGHQIGGHLVKSVLSRLAGTSLYWLARTGTKDATNSFKAYSKAFVDEVGIDSRAGFEVAIELVVKARRLRQPVAEIPTTWIARTSGTSHFRLFAWLPDYLRWYTFAFGRPLDTETLRQRAAKTSR